MQPKIQDFARTGVVTYTAYPKLLTGGATMAQVVDEIGADLYYDAVEVTWISDAKARTEAIAAARNSTLSALFAVQPYLRARKLNLSALDNSVRVQALKVCKDAIDQALAWDAREFALISGPDPGPENRAAATSQLVRSLQELCAYATGKETLTVLLETCDRKPFGANQLIGPTAEAVEVARQVRTKNSNFGLMLNLGNLPMLEETSAHALETAKDYLMAVRLGNCVMKDPNHPAYGKCGMPLGFPDGEIGREQLVEFVRELFRIGFLAEGKRRLGELSFDVGPLAEQNPADVLSQAKEMLDEALMVVRPPAPVAPTT
jgi:hypothetical protein